MNFVRGRANSRSLWCGTLGCLAVIFSFEAFRQNSWAQWRTPSNLCLSLPLSLGCSEYIYSREILGPDETDFAWLCFISIFPSCGYVFSCVLQSVELKSRALRELKSRKYQTTLTLISAALNFLTFLISIFRTRAVTDSRTQMIFQNVGLSEVYSTSCYLVLLATFCSAGATIICHRGSLGRGSQAGVSTGVSTTVKQHMARDLMYPDSEHKAKMITFSSMSHDMEEAAAELAVRATMQFELEEDIAECIKQNFESDFGPTWHCAVGSTFGSAVHHYPTEYIEIALPHISILLFRHDEPEIRNPNPYPKNKSLSTVQGSNSRRTRNPNPHPKNKSLSTVQGSNSRRTRNPNPYPKNKSLSTVQGSNSTGSLR